jgi:hypothetical protein
VVLEIRNLVYRTIIREKLPLSQLIACKINSAPYSNKQTISVVIYLSFAGSMPLDQVLRLIVKTHVAVFIDVQLLGARVSERRPKVR